MSLIDIMNFTNFPTTEESILEMVDKLFGGTVDLDALDQQQQLEEEENE